MKLFQYLLFIRLSLGDPTDYCIDVGICYYTPAYDANGHDHFYNCPNDSCKTPGTSCDTFECCDSTLSINSKAMAGVTLQVTSALRSWSSQASAVDAFEWDTPKL